MVVVAKFRWSIAIPDGSQPRLWRALSVSVIEDASSPHQVTLSIGFEIATTTTTLSRNLAFSDAFSLAHAGSSVLSLTRSLALLLSRSLLDLLLSCSPALPLRLSRSLALLLSRWLARAECLTLTFSVAFSLVCSLLRCLALSLCRFFFENLACSIALLLSRPLARWLSRTLAVSFNFSCSSSLALLLRFRSRTFSHCHRLTKLKCSLRGPLFKITTPLKRMDYFSERHLRMKILLLLLLKGY